MSKWTDAIRLFSDIISVKGEISKISYIKETHIDTALEALNYMEERDNPKPLTLAQLKERVDKPVWIEYIQGSAYEGRDGWMIVRDYWAWDSCGKTWLAYDHKSKESV